MRRKGPAAFFVFFALLYWADYSVAAPIPDTEQTKCYSISAEIPCPSQGQSLYGQDGIYNINQPSYTKIDASGNVLPDSAASWELVKDNVTGLIWEVKKNLDGKKDYSNPHDADNSYTWYDSNPATNGGNAGTFGDGTNTEDFVEALNDKHFGGFTDWRLPTIDELTFIVDRSNAYPVATINLNYFPNTLTSGNTYFPNGLLSSWYWSSTTNVYDSLTKTYDNNYAWGVDFSIGCGINDGIFNVNPKKNNYGYVRAVRGGQAVPLNRFIDNKDGTVTDSVTGLMWQKSTAPYFMSWEQAIDYCENLSISSYHDWRLPNIYELKSIVDYKYYYPAIDTTVFPDTFAARYWSSTTYAGNIDGAWMLDFTNGTDKNCSKSYDDLYVRAVRGGQPCIYTGTEDNSDGTFNVTAKGLRLQQDSSSKSFNWEGAQSYYETQYPCNQMNCQRTSIKELQNMVDHNLDVRDEQAGLIGNSVLFSNSIGPRNSIKITDMSGTLPTAGEAIQVTAWEASGKEIPESGNPPDLSLYSFGTTVISGSDLAARFPLGAPMTYQFSINSSKLLITNVKSSSDGTINIPTVYAAGLNNFVSNSIGPRNSIKITDMSGTLPTAGAAIQVAAWEASGKEIPESGNPPALNLYSFGTTVISGSDLAARFPLGVPITYQFSIDSSKLLITNVKSSSDGTINIPTVFTIGPYGGM